MRNNDILSETISELTEQPSTAQALTVNFEMLGILMNNLTNLYSDPKAGAFRETLANSIDSHVHAANNTEDLIEVELPNHDTNQSCITITDYGTGMSRETLVANFLSYGNSLKREDNQQAGRFGYGGKSPLAVASSFHLTSVKDGLMNSFTVSKNPDNTEEPPEFKWDEDCLNSPVPVDAKNSVSVSYHINPDYRRVGYTSEMVDWEPSEFSLLGVPHNRVSVDGKTVTKTVHNPDLFEPVLYENETVGWTSTAEEFYVDDDSMENSLYVHIGNVVYKISARNSDLSTNADRLKAWQATTILNAPIGSLDLTPSRDELRYTPRTMEALNLLAGQYLSAVNNSIQLKVNRSETMQEAVSIVSDLCDKKFPFQSGQPVTYRNHGDVLTAVKDIQAALDAALRAKNPIAVEYETLLGSGKNRNSYSWFGGTRRSVGRLFHMMNEFPVYVYSPTEKTVHSRVRRNWDLLANFGKQSAKHGTSNNKKRFVLISEEFIRLNNWTEGIFGKLEKYEEASEAAREARKAYNKEHGVRPAQRTRVQREATRKVAFVTVSVDPENPKKYILTPYSSLEDGNTLGKHYLTVVSDRTYPNFSPSNYDPAVESGYLENIKDSLLVRILYAEAHDAKMVIRTARQAPVSFPNKEEDNPLAVNEWVKQQAVPPPVMEEDEIRKRLLLLSNPLGGRVEDNPNSHNYIYSGLVANFSGYGNNSLSFIRGLEKLNRFMEENNLDSPAPVRKYSEALKTAFSTVSSSELTEWVTSRTRNVFNRTVYPAHYLSKEEYGQQHKATVRKIQQEMNKVSSMTAVLLLTVSLYEDEASDEGRQLLARQAKAIIEVLNNEPEVIV